jgi:prepilin-type N-terminal cleavage/methylation domain-containing protein
VKTFAANPRATTGALRRRGVGRAFTLIELLATLIVVSTLAAVASPIVMTATDAYAKSAKQRRGAERVAAALDRLTRILREAPAKATPAGATDFKSADASSFALQGGTGVALTGSNVTLEITGVPATPLCPDVTAFAITYLDSSGVAVNVASGTDTVRRVIIRLAAGGTELSTSVWLRASLNE